MLKRQRPTTPPPSSLGDSSSFLPDSLTRPLQPEPSQPRSKRQRTRPPPLDGALRGWLQSEPTAPHGESDGEEDWTEDACDVVTSPLPPSVTANQYKDTNNLLHELHVLNQHRLLFIHPPRDRPLSPTHNAHIQGPPAQQGCTDGPLYHPASSRLAHCRLERRDPYSGSVEEKGLVEEVQCVRQRYEDANKLLGSFFLSRRREVEGNLR